MQDQNPPPFAEDGARLKLARARAQVTAEAAAHALGVSKSTFSSYERGLTAIPADRLRRLCALYDVSADWLLGISEQGADGLFLIHEGIEAAIYDPHTAHEDLPDLLSRLSVRVDERARRLFSQRSYGLRVGRARRHVLELCGCTEGARGAEAGG